LPWPVYRDYYDYYWTLLCNIWSVQSLMGLCLKIKIILSHWKTNKIGF
jgi:hypothetical protein